MVSLFNFLAIGSTPSRPRRESLPLRFQPSTIFSSLMSHFEPGVVSAGDRRPPQSSPSSHPTTTIDLRCSGVTSDSKAVDFMTALQRCEQRIGGPIGAVLLSPFVYEMNGVGASCAPVSPVLCLVRGSTVACIVKTCNKWCESNTQGLRCRFISSWTERVHGCVFFHDHEGGEWREKRFHDEMISK